MRSFLDSVRVGQRKSVEGRGERGNELSSVGIMRSGVFKSIRREIKNSVCVWGQGGGGCENTEGRGGEERGRRW